jgi:hypothetical protein
VRRDSGDKDVGYVAGKGVAKGVPPVGIKPVAAEDDRSSRGRSPRLPGPADEEPPRSARDRDGNRVRSPPGPPPPQQPPGPSHIRKRSAGSQGGAGVVDDEDDYAARERVPSRSRTPQAQPPARAADKETAPSSRAAKEAQVRLRLPIHPWFFMLSHQHELFVIRVAYLVMGCFN